jgi:hypothetical protein
VRRTAGALLLAALLGAATTPDAAVLCASRKGVVRLRDACRAKETPVDTAAVGIQGPKGDKGDTGDPGPAGAPGAGVATLAETAVAEGLPLGAAYTAVAATLGADAPPTSGAWFGTLTNPSGGTVILVIASVKTDAASGTLDCVLEQSIDGGPYLVLANATSGGRELFLNHTEPGFVAGAVYKFRVSCLVAGGTREVVFATIGAVAS